MYIPIHSRLLSVVASQPGSSASDHEPTQAEDANGGIYDELIAYVKLQPDLLLAELATSWVRDLLPNVVMKMDDGMD